MPKTQPLLLDTYPNAAVAYSLRKLRSAYTGNAIRVRRSSDNAEQDFGFTSTGDLDVNSIENFVGYNLFAWSEQLQQAYWAKTYLTVTTDTLVAPDSTTTGDILFETTNYGAHVISRGLAVTAGKEYTVSFWVNPQGRNFIRLTMAVNLSTDNTTTPTAWFDLSTGTKVSDNGFFSVAPTITPDTNGWFLITYGVTANATTTSNAFQINLSPNGTNFSYTGDATKGIAVWGLQITESSSVRPYRRTEAVAEGGGFVTTYYDQSGNGVNASQSTAGYQAKIVSNGHIIINNNKPSTLWANDVYDLSSGVTPASQFITANVIDRTTGGIFATWGNRSFNSRPALFSWNTDNNINCSPNIAGGIVTITNSNYNGQVIVTTKRISGNVIQGSLNGVQYTPLLTMVGQTNVGILGGLNSTNASTGHLQETIWWNKNYDAMELNISDKINEYYGIY